MNLSAADLSIILPGFLAGVLVLLTHIPLGAQVLKRGIVFIDLAIAQIAALGVILAMAFGLEADGWSVQLAAGLAAVIGAMFLTWTEHRWPEVQEAQIGVMFVLAATASILLVARDPHGGEHLNELLAGQILFVSYSKLILPGIGTLVCAALLAYFHERLPRIGFYLIFALAVTMSVQLVGVYLVFSSLIVPSLAVRNYHPARRLLFAFVLGVGGYMLGLILSAKTDLPAGALIVWCLSLLAMLVYGFGPDKSAHGESAAH